MSLKVSYFLRFTVFVKILYCYSKHTNILCEHNERVIFILLIYIKLITHINRLGLVYIYKHLIKFKKIYITHKAYELIST